MTEDKKNLLMGNAAILQALASDAAPTQIQSYNKAIDDAIGVVKVSLAWLHPEEIDSIISKLQSLKK